MDNTNTLYRPRSRKLLWIVFAVSTLVLVLAVLVRFFQMTMMGGSASPGQPDSTAPWITIGTIVASFVASASTMVGIIASFRKQKTDAAKADIEVQQMRVDLEKAQFELEQLRKGTS